MPAHLGAQNAEAVLGVVVGDALDKARQNFLVLIDSGCGLMSVSSQLDLMARKPEHHPSFLDARRAAFPVASLKRWRGRLSVANRRCSSAWVICGSSVSCGSIGGSDTST